MSDETEWVLVKRDDLLRWAEDFARDNDPGDDTDIVTPFDDYLLRPPAEAQPDWEAAPPGATHYQPHQGAYYKRVSASEWYVWSRVEDRELPRWLPSPGTSDSAEWVVRPTDAHPPPSASVGVEGLRQMVEKLAAHVRPTCRELWEEAQAALAQQPASDGGFTAADMMDARQEGRKEAQQPAAVDGAMERVHLGPSRLWQADLVGGQISVERMREILTAALAGQQGGES